jgi:hypothetical protein
VAVRHPQWQSKWQLLTSKLASFRNLEEVRGMWCLSFHRIGLIPVLVARLLSETGAFGPCFRQKTCDECRSRTDTRSVEGTKPSQTDRCEPRSGSQRSALGWLGPSADRVRLQLRLRLDGVWPVLFEEPARTLGSSRLPLSFKHFLGWKVRSVLFRVRCDPGKSLAFPKRNHSQH